jgi:Domain of unknown function (DUF4365)
MSKFYDRRTLNHQQAVMWVGQQVIAMGNVFNMLQTEAGIDGMIELADPQTGAASASFLGVQVKTAISFDAESGERFSFYADGRDIAYWKSSQIPVLLVVCRSGTEEAYAVIVQDYFKLPENRNTKTVVFNKRLDSFRRDETWARQLVGMGVPHTRGFSFPPLPKEEILSSNLLETVLPKNVYSGRSKLKTRAEIIAELRNAAFEGHEFILREGLVWTVHPLSASAWSGVVENSSITPSYFVNSHSIRTPRNGAMRPNC